MRFTGLFVCIILLFSICIIPVSADKDNESWEKYFFLSDNSSDIKLLKEYLDWTEDGALKAVEEDLELYNAKLNFSRAYISYIFNYNFPYDEYEYSSKNTNYDGVPDYFPIRSVCVPAYSGSELKCSAEFMILYPLYSPPATIHNGNYSMFEYMGLSNGAEPIKESFIGAEKAYESIKQSVANIKQIMISWRFNSRLYIITTEEEYGGYIFIDSNDIYDFTCGQLYTFEEFAERLVNDDWHTPESTPTITPTPTRTHQPSKTAATSRPTVTVSTAAPSAEQTASPMLTAAASILPSPSAESNSSAADAVFIVLGVILGCAAAGGIVWAVMSARRKKAGK